ncbi:MAG: hypothetical protein AAFY71_05360 [Bacteroidota bacterium]
MKEFESISEFSQFLSRRELTNIAVQNLDLRNMEEELIHISFKDCLFLGCDMSPRLWNYLYKDNYIFSDLSVPFDPYPNSLYNKETLYKGYQHQQPSTYQHTPDKVMFDHFEKVGRHHANIRESLAQWLHDHSITDALYEFLRNYDEKKVVAIMGGHSVGRGEAAYIQAAEIAKTLTEEGYLMISGGGPGVMEATHVGAWFGGRKMKDMYEAIEHLAKAPTYDHPNWLQVGFQVFDKFPETAFQSLGIPTWHYGHEPPTPFATHIAKYFHNSHREEGLLAISKGGIVFAPGSAGTMQEIFQDLAQNHYQTFGFASPMVFMNKSYWTLERPLYTAIEYMSLKGALKNLNLGIYDTNEEIIKHLRSFV